MKNPEARKLYKHASDNANQENIVLMDKMTKKRYEAARLLNYTSFSERAIQPMMAKNI